MLIAFRALLKGKRGQAMVEFAIVVILFFAFLFVFIDMMKIAYVWLSVQYSVNKTIRWGRPNTYTEEAISEKITGIAGSLGVDLGGEAGGAVNVTADSRRIEIEIQKDVEISPLSGMLLQFMGSSYVRTYRINLRELVSREITNIRHEPGP